VLAVDDSITYLQELADGLRHEGYEVILARAGEEALDMLAVQPVDCILLDLIMPGIGGQETCRRIKSASIMRDIPLIMLTALEDRLAMIAGLGAGADDYISKSSEFEVLKARVRAQLRRKQFEDENRSIRDELVRKVLETAEARAAKELAETRAALVEELEQKNQELESFSYSVSHDLRAPLRSIDGFCQILVEECEAKLEQQEKDYLNRVRSASQRMGELIDDLLALSMVSRDLLQRQRIDLSTIARKVIEELQRRTPERLVEIVIGDGIIVDADSRLITIVLENLIGNAWKFTGKCQHPRIECLSMVGGDGLTVIIRDNGAGFDMKFVEKLFKPFQRLHTERDFPGTGIGLATVRRIIDRHGGRLWVESAIGRGTTFFFTLAKGGGDRA
jgi:light-regulated signal transduction histidine kinase (bacteriophytochrome)